MHSNSPTYIILPNVIFLPAPVSFFTQAAGIHPVPPRSDEFRRCAKSKVLSDASQQIFHYRDKVHKALIASALARPNTQYNRLCRLRSIRSCHTDIYPRENCSTPHNITSHLWHKEQSQRGLGKANRQSP